MDPKEVKKLKALWDKKLKQSGFIDAENKNGQLLSFHSFHFNHPSTGWDMEARAEYFRRCEQFLNNHEFKSKRELNMWTMHSKGDSLRKIAIKLQMNRIKATEMLNRLKEEMKKWVRLESLSDDF